MSIAIILSIVIHNTFSGTNLFLLMSIAIILSTIITLVLVTGWQNECTKFSSVRLTFQCLVGL